MKFSEMNVISIDPSLRSTGIYVKSPIAEEEYSSCIKTKGNLYRMLALILSELDCDELIYPELWNVIDIAIIEKQFMNNEQQKVCGVIMGVIARNGIPIVEIQPQIWQSIIGWDRLLKGINKKTAAGIRLYLDRVKSITCKSFDTTDEADAYMMYSAVCDIMDKPGRLTQAAERIRLEIRELLK